MVNRAKTYEEKEEIIAEKIYCTKHGLRHGKKYPSCSPKKEGLGTRMSTCDCGHTTSDSWCVCWFDGYEVGKFEAEAKIRSKTSLG